jgi:FAD/FMN-containing dehydrogenase/Fe-S oxidoreductase
MPNILNKFKKDLLNNNILNKFSDKIGNKIINATDNSIYEVMPLAIFYPDSIHDITKLCKIINQPQYREIDLIARGGGTGTNGQALGNGIIIDTYKLNKISDLDLENNTIKVESGVVLKDLNDYLKPYGLFFAPNVSTENRATIGGMIANDSAGKGSLIYGKTNDHVIDCNFILINGDVINNDNIKNTYIWNQLNDIKQQVKNNQNKINAVFKNWSRPLSGYNLKEAFNNDINLIKLISGSEGTLGILYNAILKLTPIPKYKTLLISYYNNFLDALDDSKYLIKYQPLAIETIDEKIQKCASMLPIWQEIGKLLNLSKNENYVSNFIEFNENDKEVIHNKLNSTIQSLKQRNIKHVIIDNIDDINKLWAIRTMAVGLSGKIALDKKPVAFVEDALVPPHNLKNFVYDFQKLLELYNLEYAMYGHSDVGCIHVRPLIDLTQPNDIKLIRLISDKVVDLTKKYDGILWGEHGKGYRGEYIPQIFGNELYQIMINIKQIFDPYNQLNRGKLVVSNLDAYKVKKIDQITLRGELDSKISNNNIKEFYDAIICNGNALCFNHDKTNTMCPSYKVTQNRIESPKGRAMLVKEWLRNIEIYGIKHLNTIKIAHEAKKALDSCLGCKGCSGKCPTGVSIPELRSNFYNKFHNIYSKRTLTEWLLCNIEKLINFSAKMPKLYNKISQIKFLPKFGIINQPKLQFGNNIFKELNKYGAIVYKPGISQITNNNLTVYILCDVFTTYIESDLLINWVKLLKKLNYKTVIIPPINSGKALLVHGKIEQFKKVAKINHDILNSIKTINNQSIIISLDNVLTLLYRDEYPKFGINLPLHVISIAEFLVNINLPTIKNNLKNEELKLILHCTEQSNKPNEAILWQNIFTKLGSKIEIINTGCCGMAGSYGHLKKYTKNSKKLFDLNWRENLEKNNCLATGFSCRSQTKIQMRKNLMHPIIKLLEILEL